MRYQLFDDDLGSFLVVDTWRDFILAKTTTLTLGSRICQQLNKRLGTDEAFDELYQIYLTKV